MNAPLLLPTTRLVLRKPVAADIETIFERYATDAQVTRYLSWPTHQSLDDTRAFIAFSDEVWARSSAGPYLIQHRSTGALLGSTGLDVEAGGRASIGYVLARDAWGYGYATEAVNELVNLAPKLQIRVLYARVHSEHVASQRVLLKSGFARDEEDDQLACFPNHERSGLQQALCFAWRDACFE